MNWTSWTEFWSMGGYGFFVWGAYALGAIGIAVEVVSVRSRFRSALNSLQGRRSARS